MKLKYGRIFAGMALGVFNFFTVIGAFAFAFRHGILGPSPWYDGPVCLALMFGPGLAWIAYVVRLALKSRGDGRKLWLKALHGTAYLTSMPAAFGMAALVCSSI